MGHLGARSVAVAVGMAVSVFLPATAWSTEGYFQLGFSPVQNSLGGAGVANSEDAMSMALNPAGLVGIGQQFQAGVGLFMPYRGYTGSGTGFVAPGTVDSSSNLFYMPNMAYSRPIDADSAWGVVLYGNGGMNTTYKGIDNANCGGAGAGVFCGGDAGVDLMQAFLSVDYARRFGNISVGIAPTLAVQSFKAKGLGGFGITESSYDWSYGGGLRAGIEADITKQLRLGLSGQTQMWMTKFDKYSNLFADQGSFDIPASITAGVAYDVNTRLTVMADFQRIFYSGVGAVSNPSNTPLPFGATDGPGFGWHDVNVYKVGVEYRLNDTWTFRAGYAYSDNPVQSADVMLNILAPGVVQHHFTAGATYKFSKKDAIDFAFVYAPEVKVSGPVPMGGGTVELNMHQFIGQVGWTHNF
jgi:long-chain fatty acid transport protein